MTLHDNQLIFFSRFVKLWRREKLMIFIIIGVALGFLVGLLINAPVQDLDEPTKSTLLDIIGFPG